MVVDTSDTKSDCSTRSDSLAHFLTQQNQARCMLTCSGGDDDDSFCLFMKIYTHISPYIVAFRCCSMGCACSILYNVHNYTIYGTGERARCLLKLNRKKISISLESHDLTVFFRLSMMLCFYMGTKCMCYIGLNS